jgi:hypothetical protein
MPAMAAARLSVLCRRFASACRSAFVTNVRLLLGGSEVPAAPSSTPAMAAARLSAAVVPAPDGRVGVSFTVDRWAAARAVARGPVKLSCRRLAMAAAEIISSRQCRRPQWRSVELSFAVDPSGQARRMIQQKLSCRRRPQWLQRGLSAAVPRPTMHAGRVGRNGGLPARK